MGAKFPGNESSICGLFTPKNESAEERKVQIPCKARDPVIMSQRLVLCHALKSCYLVILPKPVKSVFNCYSR